MKKILIKTNESFILYIFYNTDKEFTEGCGYIEANEYEPEYLCIKKKEGECSSLDDHYIYVNNQWQLYGNFFKIIKIYYLK